MFDLATGDSSKAINPSKQNPPLGGQEGYRVVFWRVWEVFLCLVEWLSMQQIVRTDYSPVQYAQKNPHEVFSPPLKCKICKRVGRLHRHGIYERNVWDTKVLVIAVARFLCPGCGHTTSLLPQFALPYRLMALAVVDAFFRAEVSKRSDFGWSSLLHRYRRRWEKWWPDLRRKIGCFFGPLSLEDPYGVWIKIGDREGCIAKANRILVEKFTLSLFGQYVIHSPVDFSG